MTCGDCPRNRSLDGAKPEHRLIATHMTIPIPEIVVCSIDDEPQPIPSFLILQHIEGKTLPTDELLSLNAMKK